MRENESRNLRTPSTFYTGLPMFTLREIQVLYVCGGRRECFLKVVEDSEPLSYAKIRKEKNTPKSKLLEWLYVYYY